MTTIDITKPMTAEQAEQWLAEAKGGTRAVVDCDGDVCVSTRNGFFVGRGSSRRLLARFAPYRALVPACKLEDE